ncbi:hypothetical protein OUZ56_033036 [Daphnia magna]|uniref:Tc1-like transposase DDE domain-containing protein n=1 Tax=Daphnia magna TaxID=35525 RepID=A0ABR0BA21_9CRUS|nr:hypothetical protein OUZ56_033036 [Daphnia magna]
MFPVVLKSSDKSDRVLFAKENLNVRSEVWLEAIACDELNLCYNENGTPKWSVHFGGRTPVNSITLKTWSCLSKSGCIIEEIKEKFDSAAYEQLLDKHVSKIGCDIQPRFFLQDNFPVHLAPRIDHWFTNNKSFILLRLPKNSPDLMPLCLLHEVLVSELNKQEVVFSVNFSIDLNRCLQSICQSQIESLLLEMPTTLKYIIEHNGELRKL